MVKVVIGADKGIGLEIVKALTARGERDVAAVCLGKGEDAALRRRCRPHGVDFA